MGEQTSIFDTADVPAAPEGWVTGIQFMDLVQVEKDEDPLHIYQERLRHFFGKDSILQGNRLWIPWAGRWTYCVAVRPDDPEERARGIVYIYRAIYEKTS